MNVLNRKRNPKIAAENGAEHPLVSGRSVFSLSEKVLQRGSAKDALILLIYGLLSRSSVFFLSEKVVQRQ